MLVKKLTNEEATAIVAEHFRGRCAVYGDAYEQRIFIDLPNGRRMELERSLYFDAKKLKERMDMLSREIDEWEARHLSSR